MQESTQEIERLRDLLRRVEPYLQDMQHFISSESLDRLVSDLEKERL